MTTTKSQYPTTLRVDITEIVNACIERIKALESHGFFYGLVTDIYSKILSGQISHVTSEQRKYLIKAYKIVTPIKEQRTLLPEQYR